MNYENLKKHLRGLKKTYNVRIIGKTNLKRNIYAVEKVVDLNLPTAFLVASVHARENITADLVLRFFESGIFDSIKNFNIIALPMLNPDGVEICYEGINSIPKPKRKRFLQKFGKNNFKLWKANARGVDLNNNFNAKFNTNVGSAVPSSSGFPGKRAESEAETKALLKYIKKFKVFFTISYHSKGEEIYFNFFQSRSVLQRDKIIAERFSNSTGYVIKNVEDVSSGGFKDFCVQSLQIPSITVEVGDDRLSHPIKEAELENIFEKHKSLASDLDFAYNVVEESLWHMKKSL